MHLEFQKAFLDLVEALIASWAQHKSEVEMRFELTAIGINLNH